jgi:hypothetical protein
MSRIINCDYSLDRRIYLNLLYYFMIRFEYNNVIILNLIIFYLNYNQYINLHKYKIF